MYLMLRNAREKDRFLGRVKPVKQIQGECLLDVQQKLKF